MTVCESIRQILIEVTRKYYADVDNLKHGVKLEISRECLTSNILVAISNREKGEKFWESESFILNIKEATGRKVTILKDYMNFELTEEEK